MASSAYITPEEKKGLLWGAAIAAGLGAATGRDTRESLLKAAGSATEAYGKGLNDLYGQKRAELDMERTKSLMEASQFNMNMRGREFENMLGQQKKTADAMPYSKTLAIRRNKGEITPLQEADLLKKYNLAKQPAPQTRPPAAPDYKKIINIINSLTKLRGEKPLSVQDQKIMEELKLKSPVAWALARKPKPSLMSPADRAKIDNLIAYYMKQLPAGAARQKQPAPTPVSTTPATTRGEFVDVGGGYEYNPETDEYRKKQ